MAPVTPMDNPDELVVFQYEDGTQVSQDPRWQRAQFEKQIREQQANASNDDLEDDSSTSSDDSDYSHKTVAELLAVAKERDIDVRAEGLKKKSELVKRLEDDDASKSGS